MRVLGVAGCIGLLLLGSTALAFEVVPADGSDRGGFAANAVPEASEETTVIPGLGKLGSSSSIDFGLELLYGPSEPGKELEQPEGDIGLRGAIRQTF